MLSVLFFGFGLLSWMTMFNGSLASSCKKGMSFNDTFCSTRPDGLYAYPPSCQCFYQCSNFITYVIPCAPGNIYFDPDHQPTVCNWPWALTCERRLFCGLDTTGCRFSSPATRRLSTVSTIGIRQSSIRTTIVAKETETAKVTQMTSPMTSRPAEHVTSQIFTTVATTPDKVKCSSPAPSYASCRPPSTDSLISECHIEFSPRCSRDQSHNGFIRLDDATILNITKPDDDDCGVISFIVDLDTCTAADVTLFPMANDSSPETELLQFVRGLRSGSLMGLVSSCSLPSSTSSAILSSLGVGVVKNLNDDVAMAVFAQTGYPMKTLAVYDSCGPSPLQACVQVTGSPSNSANVIFAHATCDETFQKHYY